MGTKRSVLVDEKGLPLAIVISGANTHDIKLLEETLDHIVVLRPEPDEEHPQNLCLDAGYTGSGETVEQRNYIPHIRPRGEEKKALERNPDFRARRWVVEVTHSFFNRFRKLLVRYEKKAVNYMALLQFACAVIVWRKLSRVHRAFRDRTGENLECFKPKRLSTQLVKTNSYVITNIIITQAK